MPRRGNLWVTGRLARYSLLFLVAASPLLAITETQRIERLEMLADIWGKLYLFHPSIVTSQVDWSRVLIETIPKIEKAADTDELVAVLNDSLFQPLDDTFTRAQKRETVALGPVQKLTARQLSGNVGYLDATDPRDYGSNAARRVGELVRGLGPVKALIVDLPFAAPQSASFAWLHLFLDSPQTSGSVAVRVHEGWNEDNANNSPGARDYHQVWNVRPGSALKPVSNVRSIQIPTVFVVNDTTYPQTVEVLDVLQATGSAAVILERRGRFESFLDDQYPQNIDVRLHTSLLLSKFRNLRPEPDYTATGPIPEAELTALAEMLHDGRKSRGILPSRPFSF